MIKDKKIKYFFPSSTRNLENEDVLCFVKRRRDGEINKLRESAKNQFQDLSLRVAQDPTRGEEGGANKRNASGKKGREKKQRWIDTSTHTTGNEN